MSKEDYRNIPYSESGETEKRVRNVHIIIGLSMMGIQFLLLSFEDFLFTTGVILPVFIMIVGVVYGVYSSKESDRLFLDNIIKPRLEGITGEQETGFLSFRSTLRVSALFIGYLLTVVFTWIWLTLTSLGARNLFGLVLIFPMFALLIPALGLPIGLLLKRTKYKSIRPLLDVEQVWLRSLRS